MYHSRLAESRLEQFLEFFPVVAVLGARQVGKTTLVETILGDRFKSITFDPVQDIGQARSDPDLFLQNNPPPLFLDEVQYAPELLSAIKRRVDKIGGTGHYVISGSQNLTVLKDVSESLAGRVGILNLLPMSRREIHSSTQNGILKDWLHDGSLPEDLAMSEDSVPAFDAVFRGGYPRLLTFPDDMLFSFFDSYMQTYIERDVRKVADIGNLQTFGAFIRLLAAHTAQEVNQNQLGRELGVDRKTAVAWTEIAESTYQWLTIPAYTRNPLKRILRKGKGVFMDTGFACYLQRISAPEAIAGHPMQGRLFESYVILEILKSFQNWPARPSLYHFRTYAGAEVDLILEFNGKLYPIEIKCKSNPGIGDCRGFASFRDCFPREHVMPGLLVCAVERATRMREDVWAIPWWLI
ncbi:MAG: ATP-binding protein [Lentisphaeria bacterium]|nr:ATP-binding protein [Lentisphaeria bacterium]